MLGQMMKMPLLVSSLLKHAELNHGEREVVSRRVEGDIHRYTYVDMARRARQLANALKDFGVNRLSVSARWLGMVTAIWSCITPSPALARCCTPLILVCIPIRWCTSPTMQKIKCSF